MYVVLGASGHTGEVVARNLLAAGQKVRVVGRSADRLQNLAAKGAETFVADASDAPALTRAFKGAEAAYVLIPPNPTSNEYRVYQDRVSDAITAAVQNAGIKNVVSLSSIGADKASGTGPVVGLYNLEQKLNQIDGANVLHLRAGYFMENTLPQVAVIRMMGGMAGPVRPDLKLGMIATRDIGAAAADALAAQGISRQADARTAGAARFRLRGSCRDRWQRHWQKVARVRSGARRPASRRFRADGNVRQFRRPHPRDGGRYELGTHEGSRTAHGREHHADFV